MSFPIGYIYTSSDPTSPASLFGGSWSSINERFLLGSGTTYAAGSTGGEAGHVLTTGELPTISGGLGYVFAKGTGATSANGAWKATSSGGTKAVAYQSSSYSDSWNTVHFRLQGSNQAHNNLPPYTVVYMWERTA